MKIVPSTRKIRNSGGTITKVTCCAIVRQEAEAGELVDDPVHDRDEEREQDAEEHAEHDEVGAVRLANSAS